MESCFSQYYLLFAGYIVTVVNDGDIKWNKSVSESDREIYSVVLLSLAAAVTKTIQSGPYK
jgi:hypothetical protein